MNIETLADNRIGRIFVGFMAGLMESSVRYRFSSPLQILRGVDIQPGQYVLEVGCGTGFFTLPAAKLIGDAGRLTAMDVLQASVDAVSLKVRNANLKNVNIVKGNVMNNQFVAGRFDAVLVFGVIPAPMLPLDRLLPEMVRILKPGGLLAVWPPSWTHPEILRSGLFTYTFRKNGVCNYRRR